MQNIKQTQNHFIRFNNKMKTLTDIYNDIKKCDKSDINDLEILKTEITDDIYEILELIHIDITTLLKENNIKKCIETYMNQKLLNNNFKCLLNI